MCRGGAFLNDSQRHGSSQHRVRTAQNLEADLTDIGPEASLQPRIWTDNNYTLSCRNRKRVLRVFDALHANAQAPLEA
jgi:hypothetical protein